MSEVSVMSLLQALGDGRVMDDFHERLHELLMAVQISHKKGKVVLTVTVKPTKDAEVPRAEVHGDVTAKIPHIERSSELFYLTEEYRLSRRNPRQPVLPSHTVRMPPAEEREDMDGKSLAAGEQA